MYRNRRESMKGILIALSAILAVSTARIVITAEPEDVNLLGSNECTWGPSYWCENLKTAKGCDAVNHCIHQYWKDMEVPEDNDSVCQICKDMVQQARDQLESNQTQKDLKDVFEGSCKLIHIEPIVQECIKIVDQFIPELVETLASQMNPSVVCSVAGLCNNAHIDKLLSQYPAAKKDETKTILLKNDELEPDECTKCYTIAKHMESKFHHTPQNAVLYQFLNFCRQFGTFTDACSSIVVSHFTEIYDHLQNNFNADNICHLSGQCSSKYHKHEDDVDAVPKVEITPMSSVGMVDVGDDLPCKLCEQLVGHLKDLLVANTTELEFKEVLLGFCKQTKSFANECKAIVEEYYPQIYEFLTEGLDSNVVCQMTGICPSPGKTIQGPIWPLVPEEVAQIGRNIMNKQNEREIEVAIGKEKSKLEVEAMQLPIDRLMPYPLLQVENVNGKETCALCEYVLHYIQEAVSNPINEEKLKNVLEKVCEKIPVSIEGQCKEFVDTYGNAIIGILIQEIDPSQVCPMIHLCPSEQLLDTWEKIPKEFIIEEKVEDKPSCPLCLLAVTQIYNVIKNNKTQANIEAELNKLCNHLPRSLTEQCTDFVKYYSKELVEMLLADLTPQEVCVYLKLCNETKDIGPQQNYMTQKDEEILTNEIPDYPLHRIQPTNIVDDGMCIICEFAMQYIDKKIASNKTRDEIEHAVHSVCNHLPKTVSKECNKFVDQYADILMSILAEDVSPKEACSLLGLCKVDMIQIQESIAECALCRAIISEIDKLLGDPKIDTEIEAVVKKVCKYLPADKQDKCNSMINIYGPSIINMLRDHVDNEKMCNKMALCSPEDYFSMSFVNTHESINDLIKKCTLDKSFVCKNEEMARLCNVTKQCEDFLKNGEIV